MRISVNFEYSATEDHCACVGRLAGGWWPVTVLSVGEERGDEEEDQDGGVSAHDGWLLSFYGERIIHPKSGISRVEPLTPAKLCVHHR